MGGHGTQRLGVTRLGHGSRCCENLVMVKCKSHEVNDGNNMIEREGGQKKGRVEIEGG